MNTKAFKDKLIADHKRLIESEASKHSKFIPQHVMEIEAYRLANEAAEEFDPKMGLQFSTLLVNKLKKLSRISTTYGGLLRVPEDKQFKLQRLNGAENELRDEFGRDPTLNELAQKSGFSIQEINNLKHFRKKEVSVSSLAYTPIMVDDENDDWVHFVYHDLPENDKFIFEHKIGFGGKPILENEEIAKKLHISPMTVTHRVKIISDRLKEGWKGGQ